MYTRARGRRRHALGIDIDIDDIDIRGGQKSEFHLKFFQQAHFSMTQGQNFDAYVIRWKNGLRLMEKCGQSGILDDATFPSDTSIFPSAFPSFRAANDQASEFSGGKVGLMENLLT